MRPHEHQLRRAGHAQRDGGERVLQAHAAERRDVCRGARDDRHEPLLQRAAGARAAPVQAAAARRCANAESSVRDRIAKRLEVHFGWRLYRTGGCVQVFRAPPNSSAIWAFAATTRNSTRNVSAASIGRSRWPTRTACAPTSGTTWRSSPSCALYIDRKSVV